VRRSPADVQRLLSRGYVSPAEAAARTGLSAPTIYRRIRAGELKAVTVSNQLYVLMSDVEALLEPVPYVPKSA